MNQTLSHIDSAFTCQYKGLLGTQHGIAEQLAILQGVFFGAISFCNCFGENGFTENKNKYIGLYHFKPDNHHVPTGKTIEQLVRACCRDVACRVLTMTTTTTTERNVIELIIYGR